MDVLLRVKGLEKGQILRGISFEMRSGELLGVMGPSGSGKSTLLYNVSGMDHADSGEVWIGDTDICALSEDEKAALRLHRLGFVFQQMNVLSGLTILENIVYPAVWRQKKAKKGELNEKARKLMEKLSIEGLETRKVTEVSGGQLQRACICRSLMNDPQLIFADEPTGALNQSAAAEVMEVLERVHEEGTAILMVTHDARVAAHCDRILYLLDGQIVGEFINSDHSEQRVSQWLGSMGW